MTAEQIINKLKLKPLSPEGGYFAVTHTSDEQLAAEVLPERYTNAKFFSGAIYYLVTSDNFSALHKLPSDELYYFHYGDPMEMLFLPPKGEGVCKILGIGLDTGQAPQILAPRNWWHGSRPLPGGPHGFSLVSTSMAPAYDERDPIFGERETLKSQYPEYADIINLLTCIDLHL